MLRLCSRLTALSVGVLLTLVGLAREEKAPELSLGVPAKCELYLSFRVAAVWNGPLAKQVRTELGKEFEQINDLRNIQRELGISLEDITRLTVHTTDLKQSFGREPSDTTFILETAKPMGMNNLLLRALPNAKPQKIHGHSVLVDGQRAGLLAPDKKLVVLTSAATIETMLDPKAPKPTGLLARVVEKSKTADAVGFINPKMFSDRSDKLPVMLAPLRPLLATKQAGGWATVGYESKAEAELHFADEMAAKRGYKSVNAMRALAGVSMEGFGESLKEQSKAVAAMLSRSAKALEEAPLEQKETTLKAQLDFKMDKAEVASLLKDALIPLRVAARRTSAQNNLRQIGLAMHNYESANGTLPAPATYDKDGKALLSWRVHILPYVEQEALYREFKLDEPWDSAHNKKLIAKMPAIYAVPGAKASEPGGTFYQVFTGKDTVFSGKRGNSIANIADGTSNTLMVVESAKEVPWTKPDDLPFDPDAKMLPKLGGHFEGGFHAAFCDGSVRFIKNTIDLNILKAIITRAGGEVVNKID